MLKLKCSSLFRACGVGGEFSGGADLEVSPLEKSAAALPAQKILSFHQRPAQAQPPARVWMHLRCLHSLAGAWKCPLAVVLPNTALRQRLP